MKVFLGGTANNSNWRDYVIPRLEIDYFNPVTDNWDEKAIKKEQEERENCDFCLYVLTPKMQGVYAVAQAVDDSFKRTDKTLFCFLETDDGQTFSDVELQSLKLLKEKIASNGAKTFSNLDQAISFLNSSKHLEQNNDTSFKNVFISYGRRHSSLLAMRLCNDLQKRGYSVWVDMNNIPLAVDFQEQIDGGIRNADNFIFIISPHSVKSVYCAKEISLAKKYNKRIIPIMHIEPTDCMDKIDEKIAKINWINIRQEEKPFAPQERWNFIDDYQHGLDGITDVIENNKRYTRLHTELLTQALEWEEKHYIPQLLLSGGKRKEAQKWLLTKTFHNNKGNSVLPPCTPIELHCRYICESRRAAEQNNADVFLINATADENIAKKLIESLNFNCITINTDNNSMSDNGKTVDVDTLEALIGSDNVVILLSKNFLKSPRCKKLLTLACEYEKRIIFMLVDYLTPQQMPEQLSTRQCIMFVNRDGMDSIDYQEDYAQSKNRSAYQCAVDELLSALENNRDFYYTAKKILKRAMLWQKGKSPGMFLEGGSLETAQAWQKLATAKDLPIANLITEFLTANVNNSVPIVPEVYLSYCEADYDAVSAINNQLLSTGKSTWFEKKYLPKKTDLRTAQINAQILRCKNFVRVVSDLYVLNDENISETEFAKQNAKRVITILLTDKIIQDTNTVTPDEFTIALDPMDVAAGFSDVIRLLDSDRDYINNHTKISGYAQRWLENEQNPILLLHGNELLLAENWLKDTYGIDENENLPNNPENIALQNTSKNPPPTDLQKHYIIESKNNQENEKEKERKYNEHLLNLEKEKAAVAELNLLTQKKIQRRTAAFAALSFVVMLAAVFAFVWAFKERHIALNAKAEADSLNVKLQESLSQTEQAKREAENLAVVAMLKTEDAEKLQLLAELAGKRADSTIKEAVRITQNAQEREQRAAKILRSVIDDKISNNDSDFYLISEYDYTNKFFNAAMQYYRNGEYEKSCINFQFADLANLDEDSKNKIKTAQNKAQKLYSMSIKADSLKSVGNYPAYIMVCNNILQHNPDDKRTSSLIETYRYKAEGFASENFVGIPAGTYSTFSITQNDVSSRNKLLQIKKFYLSKTEITGKMLADFLNAACKPEEYLNEKNSTSEVKVKFNKKGGFWEISKEYANYPCGTLSFDVIKDFCNFYRLRLPTVAEWEYAATLSAKGNIKNGAPMLEFLKQTSWISNNSGSLPHTVASLQPLTNGLYDMFGNVWEICADTFKISDLNVVRNSDVEILMRGKSTMLSLRGGCYASDYSRIKIALQGFTDAVRLSRRTGFRVVKDF